MTMKSTNIYQLHEGLGQHEITVTNFDPKQKMTILIGFVRKRRQKYQRRKMCSILSSPCIIYPLVI